MKQNRYALLALNIAIFTIGSFLVKLLSFLLMPLYTSVLTTEQYGISELLNSSVEIILPIATLCIVDALYRFSIDKNINKKSLFTNSLIIVAIGDIVVTLVCIALKLFADYTYGLEFCILYIAISFYKLTTQFARGLGHTKRFAFYGVINALLLVTSNFILLVVFKGGVKEYLISFSIAYAVSGVVALFLSKEYLYCDLKQFDVENLKKMLRFCIPNIPNNLSWWVNSVSDRYIIMFFCGADISGLYTAASKLPAMINLVTSIFQQAWQYSAAKEINSKDGKVFFSNVFRVYTYVSILLCIILVVNNRFICSFLLKSQFYHAWKFVPMLLLAATFGCFSSYFGSFYGALKNNVAAMLSTLVGAIINVILNLILIPMCGGVGGAIATAVSYGVISLIRFFDLKRRVSININYLRITIQFIVLIVVVLFAMTELYTLTFIIGISGILIVIVTDFDLLKRSFSKVLSVICKLL